MSVYVRDRRVAQWAGFGLVALGTFLIWDAYDNRGRPKPFAAKFIPGL